ncbi:DUF1499 domain-containing protein [Nitrospira sp. Kam-Ns4a]
MADGADQESTSGAALSAERPVSRLALASLGAAVLAALAAVAAGFGTRLSWWTFRTEFSLLIGAACVLALAGALVSRPGGRRCGLGLALAALLLALVVAGVPLTWLLRARSVPPIHDISTDLEDPPRFVAILPLRKEGPNSAEYGGPEVAAQQRGAYPDVKPLMLPVPPDQAFERARAAARVLGWVLVDANAAEGRLEATDTTFWFGFTDDVVVRIRPAEGGSRVDVRSVSRVGCSDVGANAARIRAFLAALSRAGV